MENQVRNADKVTLAWHSRASGFFHGQDSVAGVELEESIFSGT